MNTNKNFANFSTISTANIGNSQGSSSNKLLCTDKPLILSGSLAVILKSADAAIVLQQVHYWLEKKGGKIIDGIHWIYNTYEQWMEQFPWLTKWRLRKTLYKLRDMGLLKFAQHDKHEYKRRGYYTINYEKLKTLQNTTDDPPTHRSVSITHIDVCNAHTSLQENSIQKDLLSQNTHPPLPAAVVEKKELKKGEKPERSQMMGETPETTVEKEIIEEKTQEKTQIEAPKKPNQENISAQVEQKAKLDLIDSVGIRLNVQLVALVRDFALENVKSAIAYYQQTKRTKEAKGKTINRPAGWLTDCLRNNWWQTQPVEVTVSEAEFTNWYKKAIALSIVEDVPISWLAKDRNNQYLVRQPKPSSFGAPYTLMPWRELFDLVIKLDLTEENTNNNDDFEEPD
jgi:hypothetical protein